MGEVRLGPIEWGVVTAHHLWGMGVRLEESGDDGVIVLDSIHDDFLRCNGEYWPEIGERIRVRRYIYGSPDDEVRLTSRESAMEGLAGGDDPPRRDPGRVGQLRAAHGERARSRPRGALARNRGTGPRPAPGPLARRRPATERQTPLRGRDAQTPPVAGEATPLGVIEISSVETLTQFHGRRARRRRRIPAPLNE